MEKIVSNAAASVGTGPTPVRRNTAKSNIPLPSIASTSTGGTKRKISGDESKPSPTDIEKTASGTNTLTISPEKLDIPLPSTATASQSPNKRIKTLNGEPIPSTSTSAIPVSLFAPPPSARQPLLPLHVLEAFAQIQREQAAGRVGGMRNFRGGVMRGRLALV